MTTGAADPLRDDRPVITSTPPVGDRSSTGDGRTRRRRGRWLVGVAVVVVASLAVRRLAAATDVVPPLAACLLAGIVLGNVEAVSRPSRPGFAVARSVVLRLGIAVLGLRLAVGDVLDVGAVGLAALVGVVAVTFLAVRAAGHRLGLSGPLSTMMAAGFAVCGASAVAAVSGTIDADDDEIALATALTTLFGTLSLALLPLLAGAAGAGPAVFGFWSGASVNDVGQAVATASLGGTTALQVGVVAKLGRVVLLAPLLVLVGSSVRRRRRADGLAPAGTSPLPWFVVAFLAAAAVRSTGMVPTAWLSAAQSLEVTLIGAGLVGVGSAVRWRSMARIGVRPLVLGVAAWAIVLVAGGVAAAVSAGA